MHIVFNGPPGSGKDEACEFLKTMYGFKHLRFKDQLFVDAIHHYGVSLNWFMNGYHDRSIKERKEDMLGGISRRDALIHVSENIIKPQKGKDYYGTQVANLIDQISDYCFSDGGFIEEIQPLINTLGTNRLCIVQLFRDGCNFSSDSRSYLNGVLEDTFIIKKKTDHVRQIVETLPLRMYQIHNNGSVGDFHKAIKTIIRKESNVRQEKHFPRKPL